MDVTANVDVTNGVVTVIWDPAKLTLLDYAIYGDYSSVLPGNGSFTFGYIALQGIPAGEALATLVFEAVDPADAEVNIVHKQINNETAGECTHNGTAGAPVTENKVDADCTNDGSYDTVTYCTKCGCELSRVTTVIPAEGHTEVTDKAVDAGCDSTGLTECKHCSVCGEVLVKQETVPAKGHTVVIDQAVAATCATSGLTEGKHCSVCNTVLVAQQAIAATGHSFTNYVSNNDATTEKDGTKTAKCDHGCGQTDTVADTGSKLPAAPTTGITSDLFTVGEDTVSGIVEGVTVEQLLSGIKGGSIRVVDKNGAVIFSGKAATGMVIQLMSNGKVVDAWTVVVAGDVNGDGNISVSDMLAVKAHVLNKSKLTGAAAEAADTNGDGFVSITDFIQIKAHILGISSVTPM